jgi:hypothetical protein
MRCSFIRLASGLAIGIVVALTGSSVASAQSVMKVCGDQWKQAKAAGTTNGETWPQFLAQCREQQKAASTGGGTAPASSTFGPAPAAPAPSYSQAPAGGVRTASQCNAEYAANKAAIRSSGQTKRDFVAACRAGNETIPQGAAAAPPAAAPAPTQSGSLFPWQQPASPPPAPATYAPAPTPAPAKYGSAAAPTGAGEFTSEQQARNRCPSDTVVWVNTKSRVYHFAGTENYGHTKRAAYMCEADAKTAGARAAMNEKHP